MCGAVLGQCTFLQKLSMTAVGSAWCVLLHVCGVSATVVIALCNCIHRLSRAGPPGHMRLE